MTASCMCMIFILYFVAQTINGDVISANGTYTMVQQTATFYAAQGVCNSLYGSQLASIHNQQQLNEIKDLLKSTQSMAWIGLTDEYLNGHFTWIDGQPFNFTPNAYIPHQSDMNCYYFDYTASTWHYQHCEYTYCFICNTNPDWTIPIDFSFLSPLTPYNYSQSGLYISYQQSMTWTKADAYCQRMHGTHLASFTNDEQAQEIQNLCVSTAKSVEKHFCWIGLNRAYYNDHVWRWNDDSINSQYYRWINKPNMNGDCVSLTASESSIYSWTTNDCDTGFEVFVCNLKVNVTPLPTMVTTSDFVTNSPTLRVEIGLLETTNKTLENFVQITSTMEKNIQYVTTSDDVVISRQIIVIAVVLIGVLLFVMIICSVFLIWIVLRKQNQPRLQMIPSDLSKEEMEVDDEKASEDDSGDEAILNDINCTIMI